VVGSLEDCKVFRKTRKKTNLCDHGPCERQAKKGGGKVNNKKKKLSKRGKSGLRTIEEIVAPPSTREVGKMRKMEGAQLGSKDAK